MNIFWYFQDTFDDQDSITIISYGAYLYPLPGGIGPLK